MYDKFDFPKHVRYVNDNASHFTIPMQVVYAHVVVFFFFMATSW